MKKLALVLLLLTGLQAIGRKYYVKNTVDLQRIQKMAHNGDLITLEGGRDYVGGFTPRSEVTYQSVNGRARITGFTTAREWTPVTGNVFYTVIKSPNLQVVTVDGEMKGMGRYPNTGYLTYTGHYENYKVSGPDIANLPYKFEGGEIAYKIYRYILNRNRIIKQEKDAISFALDKFYGDNSNTHYPLTNGDGFFIQNHFNTLDLDGEWYYERETQRLYMYFADGNPYRRVVKANGLDRLVVIDRVKDVSFNDIDFDGALTAIFSEHSNNVNLNNCTVENSGIGIYANNTNGFNVNYSRIKNCSSNGAMMEYDNSNVTFTGSSVYRCGMIPGMGKSGDGQYNGIYFYGNGLNISKCSVIKSGYNAIYFDGNDVLIQNNFIDSFCLTKDDGGGIYAQTPPGQLRSNRVVNGNIVLHAIGSPEGAGFVGEHNGQAVPIYLDRNANHVSVESNFCADGYWNGILLNGNSNNRITGNTTFNFPTGMAISQFATSGNGSTRNSVIEGNAFVAKPGQHTAMLSFVFVADNPMNIGTMNNIYAHAANEKHVVYNKQHPYGGFQPMTLPEFQTLGLERNAVVCPVTTNNPELLHYVYNFSPDWKYIPLDGTYMNFWGTQVHGGIWVEPYRGMVIKKIITLP